MSPRERRGLGKGLGALIPNAQTNPGVRTVHVDAISPNPRQPRTRFDTEALQELATSIREVGLIQPLIVQELEPENLGDPVRYCIIAGERRWRAARLAGLDHVQVVVKEATPQQMLELALVENIQRADLNPLEEAAAYLQLGQEFGLTQERIAERVGRSRASVANTLRLLRLPDQIKAGLVEGAITEGHARALLMLDDEEDQVLAYRAVLKRQLSVRQTEELTRRLQAPPKAKASRRSRSPETIRLEKELREGLGTKVDLFRTRKGGRIVIHFYSEDDLQSLYERLAPDT